MTVLESLDEFRFHHELEASAGMALVIFTAQGCSACRHWTLLLGEFLTRHADVRAFEVDAGISPALANEFEIFHLPSLFLYHRGRFHSRLQCEARLPALERAVEEALRHPAEEAP